MGIPEYKITMLGPSGVGKTSLLTAIYEKFEDTAGKLQITIDPESKTLIQIQDCLKKLKSLTQKHNDIRIKPGQGVKGTNSESSFFFNMGIKGKNPSLSLHFQDYPGGWIASNPENIDKVVEFLRESVAVLIPIDATAIMEKNGKYHEYINLGTTVTALIQRAYQNLDSPRLVILAPVKCELYMQKQKGEELLRRVDEEYKKLIEFFQSENLRANVAVVKIPVQTVGNVRFSRLEEKEEQEPEFYFCRTRINASYEPKDSEQPIKYLLQFILKLHLEKRNPVVKLFLKLLKLDKPFREAATRFAQMPINPNCKVLQGDKWLDI